MAKVYLIEREYEKDSYSGPYRDSVIYDEDEVAYSTREAAQARCDERNQRVYNNAKSYWENCNKGRLTDYRTEVKKYNVLAAAGIKHPKPVEPTNSEFPSIEEWRGQRFFDKDWYSVVEWELQ